ncbi:MAG TPA: hypothetical protein VK041_00310, partial [Opitutales bacterium]|nr:hypothetical protein [Opitutales bacterium]
MKLLTTSSPPTLPERIGRKLFRMTGSLFMVLALAPFFAATSAKAQPILEYNLLSQPGTQPAAPPSTVAEGLFGGNIVRGGDLGVYTLNHGFSALNYSTVPEGVDGRQQAIDRDEYLEFSLTVAPGYKASLYTLDHKIRRSAVNGPMYFEWQYSFDGFATPGKTIVPTGWIWDSLGWTEDYFYYRGRASSSGGIADFYNYMLEDVTGQDDGNEMPTFELYGFEDLQNIPGGT